MAGFVRRNRTPEEIKHAEEMDRKIREARKSWNGRGNIYACASYGLYEDEYGKYDYEKAEKKNGGISVLLDPVRESYEKTLITKSDLSNKIDKFNRIVSQYIPLSERNICDIKFYDDTVRIYIEGDDDGLYWDYKEIHNIPEKINITDEMAEQLIFVLLKTSMKDIVSSVSCKEDIFKPQNTYLLDAYYFIDECGYGLHPDAAVVEE